MDLLEEELNWLNCIDYNLYKDLEIFGWFVTFERRGTKISGINAQH